MGAWSRGVLLVGFVASLAGGPALAEEGRDGPLVTAQWLERHRSDADLLLLDASPPPLFAKGHIPGAVNASFLSYGTGDASPAAMEKRLRAWGVGPGRRIVVYERGEAMWAPRLYYDLYRFGLAPGDLLLLDGGLEQWQAAGGAVTADPTPAPPEGTYRLGALRDEVRASLPEAVAASGEPGRTALVEALGPEWHYGATAFFGRSGHLPNSVLLPAKDFYRPDGRFKPREELRRMLDFVGVPRDEPVITYCGGGVAGAVPFFAMRFLLDRPQARLFAGSELEWLRDERGLPMWTYGAPYLLRDTAWLGTWGGTMLRMYGVARVSVIDVRPAEDFAFGHLPYAVNVPAAVFRELANDAPALAARLGEAGVDPAHEAVVFSGKGLDRDAALAYLLLRRAGQARVSVFVESLEQSVRAGFALPADPAAAKKMPRVPSPRARPYAATPRMDVTVNAPAPADGPFPVVFVDAGEKPFAGGPAGRVVHVPLSGLVDAAGVPLAAKDLWKRLEKAGVPRYAELIATGADAGDAAAGYFVLTLMGYPRVRALVN